MKLLAIFVPPTLEVAVSFSVRFGYRLSWPARRKMDQAGKQEVRI